MEIYMKYLAWFSGLIVSVLGAVYIVAFTSTGNALVGPMIEKEIRHFTKLDSKLTTFSLNMSQFSIVLELDSSNNVSLNGNYSIFSQAFDIAYRVRINRLESLKSLTNAPLQGKFHTEGSVKGDMAFIEVDGISDVAKSDTTYHVELTDLNPTSIIAKIKDAKLASLLYLGNQSQYAKADIDLDINFKNITPHQLDGDILLTTKNGEVDKKLMKKDFDVTLPKTTFSMNLKANLKGDDVEYSYALNSNLAKITSGGKVTPEPLKTDIKYSINIKELAVLKPITNAPFRGAFATDGEVVGSKKSMLVDGKSNIGGSKTTYKINLVEFAPTSVIASIKGAKVEKLLYMVGQPKLATSKLNVDIKLTSLDPKNLAGYADIVLANGKVNSKAMKKAYAVTIPKTTFNSKTHVKLKGKDIDYKMKFNSNLAKVSSSGNFVPDSMSMDLIYALNIKELALLKPITGADVRGAFNLNGEVKGNDKNLLVKGKSDVASSKTDFEATLKDFAPATIKASMKNLKLAKVLYMVKQPHYADGVFSLDVDISDARSGKLKGVVKSSVTKGLLDSRYMTKAYEFKTKMPRTTFSMNTDTTLDGDIIDTKMKLNSSLATLNVKRARFNMVDTSLSSDYVAKIPKLDKLFFATDTHMKGGMSVNGELKSAENLDITFHSKIADGKMDGKLHNDNLHAELKSVATLKVLHMLIYPEIFKSTLNGKVDYNLASSKGTFSGHLVDGKFTKNKMLDMVKKYGKTNLYKERFSGDVSAKLNREKILSSVDLKSKNTSINTKNAKLNTLTQKMNAKVVVKTKKYPLTVTLKGDVMSPKVGIDTKALMKSETGKKLEKEATKLFKKFF